MRNRQKGGCHMIVKLKKGSSFAGCIRYVTGKDEAKIIASDGVLLGTNAEIMQSFELQRQLNPRIKKPVGHIALSFKPEDKPRLTDEFMTKIALEYMQMMCHPVRENPGGPVCQVGEKFFRFRRKRGRYALFLFSESKDRASDAPYCRAAERSEECESCERDSVLRSAEPSVKRVDL